MGKPQRFLYIGRDSMLQDMLTDLMAINSFSGTILLAAPLAFVFITNAGCTKGHHSAEEHMHRYSFEELIQRFESPERDAYQKPDELIRHLNSFLEARSTTGFSDFENGWKGITVADLGAGSGYFTWRLAREGATVIALDIDDRFLSYIEEREEVADYSDVISTRKTDPDSSGLSREEVHIIFSVNVYHHIGNRSDYFREARNSLKNGGFLIIVDFKKDSEIGPPDHIKLSEEEVVSELRAAGYSVEVDRDFLTEQNIYLAVPK
jgi:2-polyprenyl-3-methyl-5-hydroxy-6-metoxy-1,4-benzoquinol methylase